MKIFSFSASFRIEKLPTCMVAYRRRIQSRKNSWSILSNFTPRATNHRRQTFYLDRRLQQASNIGPTGAEQPLRVEDDKQHDDKLKQLAETTRLELTVA